MMRTRADPPKGKARKDEQKPSTLADGIILLPPVMCSSFHKKSLFTVAVGQQIL
jgi:hypothetical protein